jgi:hypothetical protein
LASFILEFLVQFFYNVSKTTIGDMTLHAHMTDIYNEMFEHGQDLELRLIVQPKPGKPPGLLSSLLPITEQPVTMLRKTLSIIVLTRIRPAIEAFLPESRGRDVDSQMDDRKNHEGAKGDLDLRD